MSFSIQNTGNADLMLGDFTFNAPGYTENGTCNNVLQPSESCIVNFTYMPTEVGTFTDQLSFTTNDSDQPLVVIDINVSSVSADQNSTDNNQTENLTNTFTEDFSNDLSKWTIKNIDDIPGIVEISNNELKLIRTNAGGNGGAVGISMDTNLTIDDKTSLLFDAKIVSRDVGDGCGWTCKEYPVNILLTVKDANGVEHTVKYAVNYGNATKDINTTTSKQITKSIPQNTWARDISYNVKSAWPNAVKITNIYIYGNGWNFEGYVDNVRITGQTQTVNLNSGLVAHYEFENNLLDSSSNTFNATGYGNIEYADGIVGRAVNLDGVDDWIDTLHSFDLENRTISVWINTDTLSGTDATYMEGRHALTQNSQYLKNGSVNVSLAGTNGDYDLRMDAASDLNSSVQKIEIGKWYHLVLVKDGPNTKYYINDVLVHKGSASTSAYMSTYYNNLVIGTDRHRDRRHFDGKMDDLPSKRRGS